MRICSREQEEAQHEMMLDEMMGMYDDTPSPKPKEKKKEPYEFIQHEGPYNLDGWDEIIRKGNINRAKFARKRGLK